jgi:hypothetical protein
MKGFIFKGKTLLLSSCGKQGLKFYVRRRDFFSSSSDALFLLMASAMRAPVVLVHRRLARPPYDFASGRAYADLTAKMPRAPWNNAGRRRARRRRFQAAHSSLDKGTGPGNSGIARRVRRGAKADLSARHRRQPQFQGQVRAQLSARCDPPSARRPQDAGPAIGWRCTV